MNDRNDFHTCSPAHNFFDATLVSNEVDKKNEVQPACGSTSPSPPAPYVQTI